MRKIRRIIVHCAATREGQPFTIKDINVWHKNRGFNGVGYHYVYFSTEQYKKGVARWKTTHIARVLTAIVSAFVTSAGSMRKEKQKTQLYEDFNFYKNINPSIINDAKDFIERL